jgi:serine protease inhibitor
MFFMESGTSSLCSLLTRSIPGTRGATEMTTAFTGSTDFSGMDGITFFLVSDRTLQVFAGVNEKGTRASAATAECPVYYSSEKPLCVAICRTDPPMIIHIINSDTSPILFTGLIVSPAGLMGSEALA